MYIYVYHYVGEELKEQDNSQWKISEPWHL